MSEQSVELLEAIEHLPRGASLLMQDVAWEVFEKLVAELNERPEFRVSFDDGSIEIVSPLNEHEKIIRLIDRMVHIYGEIRKLQIEFFGSSTWKGKILAKGVQPDSCYYVNAADSVIVETQLDLDKDPPPDIAIEIDVSNSSKRKSSIYAALKISEFWRYDGRKFQIFRLTGADYTEIPSSQMLPGLTAQQLLQTINLSRSLGQTAALQRFRTQF